MSCTICRGNGVIVNPLDPGSVVDCPGEAHDPYDFTDEFKEKEEDSDDYRESLNEEVELSRMEEYR